MRLISLFPAFRWPWTLALSPMLLLLALACGGGDRSPDFEVTLYDGTQFRLSNQIDVSSVVLNFWYPTCPPCREEMPSLQKAWTQLQDEDVRFLGLFVPQGFDTEQDAKDFIDELGLTFDFATDRRASIALDYEMEVYPKTYFINKVGRVSTSQISTLDTEEIIRLVREMDQG